MIEDLTSTEKLKEIFVGVESLGGFQSYADRLRLIHHDYLKRRLSASSEFHLDMSELRQFLNDATYLATQYTNPLVVTIKEGLPITDIPSRQTVQEALSLAGTIFEFLAETVEGIDATSSKHLQNFPNTQQLLLKAALCYALGMYENRVKVLLRRVSERFPEPKSKLNFNNTTEWANYLLFSLLSRHLRGVKLTDARNKAANNVENLRRELKSSMGEKISVLITETASFEAKFCSIEGIVLCAETFSRGNPENMEVAIKLLARSAEVLVPLRNYENVWISRTICEVVRRMWNDSPRIRLNGVISSEYYVRSLTEDGIMTFWSSQIAALENKSQFHDAQGGYLDDRIDRVIVNMPTSSGKTLLAELAIAKKVFDNRTALCIYVAPARALCDQVARELSQRLSLFGIGVTSIATDLENSSFQDWIFTNTNVLVVTPEKLSQLFRQKNPSMMSAKLFVFDELQTIAAEDRGWTFESIVTLLMNHPQTCEAKMLFISAVMPNHLIIQNWVDP